MPPSLRRSSISPVATPPTADPFAVAGPPFLAGTPYRLLGVLGAGLACCAALVSAGLLARAALGIAAVTAAHGGMLATATGWAAIGARGRARDDRPSPGAPPSSAVAVTALASVLGAAHTVGALGYFVVLAWVAWHARRGHLVALGLGTPIPRGALALGILGGAFLGAHLLVSASRTLGYQPGVFDPRAIIVALAYDAGLQIVATESLFRGALFNHLQRRWSFAGAAAVTSSASVLRYLVDPLLPGTAELVIGAVFYLTLLSLLSAWLFWRSGSLVPGYLASVVFFVAYRQLGVR
jgi:membrane protease YdiL (CAAX protease family)